MLSGREIEKAIYDHRTWNKLDEACFGLGVLGRAWNYYRLKYAPRIVITPYNPKQLGPNSYNLRLGSHVVQYVRNYDTPHDSPHGPANQLRLRPIDPYQVNDTKVHPIPNEGLRLDPGEIYLCSTVEYTEAHNCVPGIEGRSSIGRLGIDIHATAGFGDVGFCGRWTLEVSVVRPVIVYPRMEICQIFFDPIGPDHDPYEGKYQHDMMPAESRLYQESKPLPPQDPPGQNLDKVV